MSDGPYYYEEPVTTNTCGSCRWRRCDSYFDESWCDRDPPPKGLGKQLTVNAHYGTCPLFAGEVGE